MKTLAVALSVMLIGNGTLTRRTLEAELSTRRAKSY